jgi:hypothetical protein
MYYIISDQGECLVLHQYFFETDNFFESYKNCHSKNLLIGIIERSCKNISALIICA